MIYLIEGGGGLYKIGTTRGDPRVRLAALQAGSPVPLRLIAQGPGAHPEEASLHQEFRQYREHGEWFRLGPKQLAHAIECIKDRETLKVPRARQQVGKSKREAAVRRRKAAAKRKMGVTPRDGGRAFGPVKSYNINDQP